MKDTWNAFVDSDLYAPPTGTGMLNNLSFALKDVFDVQGHISSAGNPDWLATHQPASEHADVVANLLKEGAALKGVTHTDELMYGLNGENAHYGTPVNPKSADRIPGGSSSGSAVAVAAGLTDFAIGTDTGGSVRIPSSYCGIFGYRPSHGRISTNGLIPLAPSFDTVGVMARDGHTLQKVGAVLLNSTSRVSRFTRLYVPTDVMELVDEQSMRALAPSINHVMESFSTIEEIAIAPQGFSAYMETFRLLQGKEIWQTHGEWIQKENPTFGEDIGSRFQWTSTLTLLNMNYIEEKRRELRYFMYSKLGEEGILVLPTAPGPAPVKDAKGPELENRRLRTLQMTCIAGLSGLPQVTIPAGELDGLPVGLSFIAGYNQDEKLLNWVKENSGRIIQASVRSVS
ncbi:amidase [Priestia megaterium]|uniref:amidase n=1 Tax=Priestia megaterium TaxID=1404 RepID=UPI0034D73B5F